jgi:hypothetical protein
VQVAAGLHARKDAFHNPLPKIQRPASKPRGRGVIAATRRRVKGTARRPRGSSKLGSLNIADKAILTIY